MSGKVALVADLALPALTRRRFHCKYPPDQFSVFQLLGLTPKRHGPNCDFYAPLHKPLLYCLTGYPAWRGKQDRAYRPIT